MAYLKHYGVKGMKWGVRRTREQLGHGKKGLKKPLDSALIKELYNRHENFKPKEVVAIGRDRTGRIVWVERGNERAGLKHILSRHEKDFIKKGIPKADIVDFIMTAATTGVPSGNQTKRPGREIYVFRYNGNTHKVALSIGSNGYIVGANPCHARKERSV